MFCFCCGLFSWTVRLDIALTSNTFPSFYKTYFLSFYKTYFLSFYKTYFPSFYKTYFLKQNIFEIWNFLLKLRFHSFFFIKYKNLEAILYNDPINIQQVRLVFLHIFPLKCLGLNEIQETKLNIAFSSKTFS